MSRYVVTRRGSAWDPAYDAELRDPDALLRRPETEILQHSARTTVGRVTVARVALVVKVFYRVRILDRFESLFLGARAQRVARNLERLASRGFQSPELVAVLERPPTWCFGPSCVVTRFVSTGQRVEYAWRETDRHGRRRLCVGLARYLRELHARGVYPQDTRTENILVLPADGEIDFMLVDADRVRLYGQVSQARRRKNLVQVYRSLGRRLNQAGQMRFLREYLGGAEREEVRAYAAAVVAAGRRKDAGREEGG